MFGSSSTTSTRWASGLSLMRVSIVADPVSFLGAAGCEPAHADPQASLSRRADACGMTTAAASAPRRARVLPRSRSSRLPRPELARAARARRRPEPVGARRNGWANEYYSAAVRSMTESWHAFLYGSFDAAGVMTVDKPPLALWVQALSARVFGFHPLSILVPQALMGVATVALVYDLVRRRFGRAAGFVAGLALAMTPIAVAISRHNNPDALLILCCVAALWSWCAGSRTGARAGSCWRGALVGLGFEAKMAAALMVVPGSPRRGCGSRRAAASPPCASCSPAAPRWSSSALAWPLLVALTPAADRPVGVGHERQQHLVADPRLQRPRAAGRAGRRSRRGGAARAVAGAAACSAAPPACCACSTRGSAARPAGCSASRSSAGLAVVVASRLRRTDARTGWLIAVGGAFLTMAVAFSYAQGIFHPYYVSQLAPFTAALVGAGAAELRGNAARVLGRAAIAPAWSASWWCCATTPARSRGCRRCSWPSASRPRVAVARASAARRAAVLAAALGALLIAPATWSARRSATPPAGRSPRAARDRRDGRARRAAAAASAARRGRRRRRARAASPPAAASPGARRGRRTRQGRRLFGGDSQSLTERARLREGPRRRRGRRVQPVGRRRPDHRPAPTSSPSAASPAARARSAPRGWPTRSRRQGPLGARRATVAAAAGSTTGVPGAVR